MFVLLLSQIENYLVFLCRPVIKYLDFSVSELASDCLVSLLFNVERIVFCLPQLAHSDTLPQDCIFCF